MTVNEDAFDVLTSHRLALLRYEGGVVRDLLRIYDRAFAEVTAELQRVRATVEAGGTVSDARIARLRLAQADLAAKIREANRVAVLTLDERLAEVGEAEADLHAGRLARTIGVAFGRVPEALVAASIRAPLGGGRWTDRLAVDLVAAHDGIRNAITEGLARGLSMPNVAAVLARTTDVQETYRNRFVAIARTEVQRVANDVALASYTENADVLDGVQWLATLDSRTCLVCAPLHAKVYPMQGGRPQGLERRPPLHPRCRCFLAPVVKPLSALVRDAKRPPADYSGGPAVDVTFDAWLRRQPAKVQTEILGEERRRLWSNGTPLGAFSDGRKVLGLGELRAFAQ